LIVDWLRWVRSFGHVGSMSGLLESGHGGPRPNLPTLLWRWPAAIAGAPPLHSVRLADPWCVVRIRHSLAMPPVRQPSPTGATGVEVIGRVAETA
jgi:hypothetical protein